MGDLISRQDAKLAIIEKGQASKRYKVGEFWELNRDEIWDALDGVPSAQPEIIRCDECKYYIRKSHRCEPLGLITCDGFWCKQAERRKDG